MRMAAVELHDIAIDPIALVAMDDGKLWSKLEQLICAQD